MSTFLNPNVIEDGSITPEKMMEGEYLNMTSGFSNELTGRIEVTPEEFTFRPSAGDKSIRDENATIKSIKGSSLVWNQKIQHQIQTTWPGIGGWYVRMGVATATFRADGYVSCAIQKIDSSMFGMSQKVLDDHKYYVTVDYEYSPEIYEAEKTVFIRLSTSNDAVGNSVKVLANNYNTRDVSNGQLAKFFEGDSNYPYLLLDFVNRTEESNDKGYFVNARVRVYDLTQMFSTGNEPTTIDEFYARIPEGIDINAYNEGEIISMNANAIETNGLNQWDENWEVGRIDINTGLPTDFTATIRSKNYIRILPNKEYYLRGINNNTNIILFYDAEYNYISYLPTTNVLNKTFITPTNANYIKFYVGNAETPVTNYNNDICINLTHTGVRDGEYEPYWKSVKDLSVIKKYFPNGMRSAGEVYDEIQYNESTQQWVAIQRIGEIDLGSLDWTVSGKGEMVAPLNTAKKPAQGLCLKYNFEKTNSGSAENDKSFVLNTSAYNLRILDNDYTDAASFKTAMSGVKLYYELAEPIVTEIDEIVNFSYKVGDFGIEKILTDSSSTAFRGDIVYGFNAVDRIRDNSRNIEKLNSEITNKVSAIRVNDTTITQKDDTGLLDIGDVSNLYVADFTIEDLEGLSETNTLLYTNARALIDALAAGKAIGIRQGNNESMSIASAYKNGRALDLTVISSSGTMYKVHIDSISSIDPEVEDNETGKIHWALMQVIPIEASFAPFQMEIVVDAVEGTQQGRVSRDSLIAILETNEPLFIHDSSSGVVPASYSVTKQNGKPTAVDIDIVYNNGLYHIHWDITDDAALYLTQDTVSYTPFSGVYIVSEFTVKGLDGGTPVTITEQFVKAIQSNARILIPTMSLTEKHYVAVNGSQSSISTTGGFTILIDFIYNSVLYMVSFSSKGTVPSQVVPRITTLYLQPKESSFKTVNGVSVVGAGNISTIQGLKNLALNKATIGTVNDDGMVEIEPGGLRGLSTTYKLLIPSNETTSIVPYTRNIIGSTITDNIAVRLEISNTSVSNYEWEVLFSVDSAESIALDVKPYTSSYSLRWKEGELSHTALLSGYYRLRAIFVAGISEVWAEIEKFS